MLWSLNAGYGGISCALHFMEVVTGQRFGQKLKLTARKKKLALSISGSISWNWCPCESYHLRMPKWPGQFQTVNLSFLVFGYQQRLHCQSMIDWAMPRNQHVVIEFLLKYSNGKFKICFLSISIYQYSMFMAVYHMQKSCIPVYAQKWKHCYTFIDCLIYHSLLTKD